MGRLGQQIIKLDVESIIADLNRAAAAELCDAFRYRYLSVYAMGLNAPQIAAWFAKTAEDEWGTPGQVHEPHHRPGRPSFR